jgi:hydrogenase expression/formation protein HypC
MARYLQEIVSIIYSKIKEDNHMCVGVPSKIVKIEDSMALIEVLGAQREVSLLLLDEDVQIGDYVIVHAGFAIRKIQEEDAHENLELMKIAFGVEDELTQAVSPTKKRSKKAPARKEQGRG